MNTRSIMYFFSSIHNPVFNAIAEFFTILGEEYVIIAIAMIFFWCIDKKKGFASFFAMLLAINVMNIVKVIVKFPRPWTVMKDLDVVRKETATGYSFPSGHTTMSASFYGSLAHSFKIKVFRFICYAIIALVAINRVYLCVHWPIDVIYGLAIGVTSAIFATRCAMFIQENIEDYFKQMLLIASVLIVGGLVVAILCQKQVIDSDMNADLYVGLAISGGVLFFSTLEQITVKFKVDGTVKQKILRYIVGMIGILLLLVGLKEILPAGAIFRYLRYLVTGIWAVWAYPLLGKKLKLFA